MQILLIDDDVELGVLLEKFLKQEGYHLDREYEGTRGLKRALEGRHDLVVLDVMLRARNSSPGLTVEMQLPGLLSDSATAS